MYQPLPLAFANLAHEPGPKILLAALADHGLRELPGAANSPRILEMAFQAHAGSYYKSDATPWCALAMTSWVLTAGFVPPRDPLAAKSWATFGTPVALEDAALGDILVMERPGGNHVTMYAGEDDHNYYGLGGNQGDCVCIAPFLKARITHVRRCAWKVAQPTNIGKRFPGLVVAGVAAKLKEY
ncbi:TIGR02594 family protein [Hymenobacter convexus]|uniref:TIGR02594 family protein n=1 Tax=Hymenobacter sp. CA1UV-4 TaxID=3063782 RepID=UPI0027130814|nr:TIGR02594 family protein [Hymenobacter sp. CA1UV-4]MDO7851408.1 TIGR02594 family protein [Hymenobacter sp. CA1UV-4]